MRIWIKPDRLAKMGLSINDIKNAKNAQMLSQQRYDKGVASYLEVLETQRQAFESELNLSKTKQELLNSYIKLYKAIGGGVLK